MKWISIIMSLVICGCNIAPQVQPPVFYYPQPNQQPHQAKPQVPEPTWTFYAKVRDVNNPSLGNVLADVDSHMPEGHIYKDNDKITWTHETSHGISSELRQKFGKPGIKINGFYCLENRAVIVEEPNVTISAVADVIPQSLRGDVYNLYFVKQVAGWNNIPLYILDEKVAYTNGSACRKDLKIEKRAETVQYMMEFCVYSIALAMTVKQNDPNYDDKQLRAFIMWNTERAFGYYQEERGAKDYLDKLKTSRDAEIIRDFAKNYFGVDWCKRVYGF